MIINKNTKLLLKSTAIVIVTSTLASLSIWMFGGNFLASLLLFVSIQYILFGFIGTIINNYFQNVTKQKELDKLEQLSSILECAYCKTHNIITFLPDENERVEFICNACNKKNFVNINFTVARITEPVILNNPNGPSLLNAKNEN
jgi:hypothetical protein